MAVEQELEQVDALERLLVRRCPWASEEGVSEAARILEASIEASGVDQQESFTMEMLHAAQMTGIKIARVLGPPPMTPGTPVTPPAIPANMWELAPAPYSESGHDPSPSGGFLPKIFHRR